MSLLHHVLAAAFALFTVSSAWAQTRPPTVYPRLDPAVCVQKPQRLLIIDLKSGWWAGDGTDLHDKLLTRMVQDCPTIIEIEYHYVQFFPGDIIIPGTTGVAGLTAFYPERPNFANNSTLDDTKVPSRPWHEYTQVSMLSGGNHDVFDVHTTHEFFKKLVRGMVEPSGPERVVPNVLLGTGLGHRDHSNEVLEALALPRMFQTHIEFLFSPRVEEGKVTILSRLRMGAELTPHALFDGVESIADKVRLDDFDVESDFVLTANHPFQVIGQNSQGEPTIAVHQTETRRFVLDAGTQRFYGLFIPTEAATYRYLHNIVKFLAR